MSRTWRLFLLLLVLPLLGLFSQEETSPDERPDAPVIGSEGDDYNITMYSRGDKTFTITLGTLIPTILTGKGIEGNDHGLSVGGTGTLSFSYFFTSNFFFGGELSGVFMGTRAGNMLYLIPMGGHIGFQFVYRRLEFPFSVMAGFAPQKYLESNYGGLIIKPGASMFWRFNPDWSFGLNSRWWFVPQWPKDGQNMLGNFLELTLSARYHF